jgi:phage shock protein C
MRSRATRFEVDRAEGKLLGVCAGLANRTGLDVTIIRVAVVLLALFASFTAIAILYFGAALVGSRSACAGRARHQRIENDETAERMRSHELRMQAIDTYVAGSNSRLAREIEELR